jgi:hypothetical protein
MQLPATAAGPAPAAIALASLSPACGGCEPGGRRNVPSVQDTPACPGRRRLERTPGAGCGYGFSPATAGSAQTAARGAPVRRAAAQLPAWDQRRQHAAPRHRTPCACPKRPRPTPAGSRSRADPGLAASRNSACPARVDPEGEGAAGRRCSQHGLPHETFRVSSQRCRAARRTRRVRSTARSRAGRAHRQAGAFLS